jgi:hypothetical protein
MNELGRGANFVFLEQLSPEDEFASSKAVNTRQNGVHSHYRQTLKPHADR